MRKEQLPRRECRGGFLHAFAEGIRIILVSNLNVKRNSGGIFCPCPSRSLRGRAQKHHMEFSRAQVDSGDHSQPESVQIFGLSRLSYILYLTHYSYEGEGRVDLSLRIPTR